MMKRKQTSSRGSNAAKAREVETATESPVHTGDLPAFPEPRDFFVLPSLGEGYGWKKAIPDDVMPSAATIASLALEICKSRNEQINFENMRQSMPDALACLVEASRLLHVAEIDMTTVEGLAAFDAGKERRLSVRHVERLLFADEVRGLALRARKEDTQKTPLRCGWVPKTDTQLRDYLVLLGKRAGRGWNKEEWKKDAGGNRFRADGWRDVKPCNKGDDADTLKRLGAAALSHGDSFVAWLVYNFPANIEDRVLEFRIAWLAGQKGKSGDGEKYRRDLAFWLSDSQAGWPSLALQAIRKDEIVPPALLAALLEIQERGPTKYAENIF
jgi:hypothetical protein